MIFAVARNRLLNLRRDRAAFILAFVLPVAFFTIFAGIFSNSGSRAATRRIRIAVVDEDGSDVSRLWIDALRAERALEPVTAQGGGKALPAGPYTAPSAAEAVRKGEIPVALVIPKGFGERPFGMPPAADRPRLQILADSSDPVSPQVVAGLLQKVAMGMILRDATPSSASVPATHSSLVGVEIRDLAGEKRNNPTVAFYAAGFGVMFLLFSATGAGGALIEEAESGTLDRILSTRVSMGTLLAGKLVYLAGVGITQLTLMFVWGAVFFGVELWTHLPGFFIMTVSTALACSTFGLLLASVCRSRMQLVALANLSILLMSALGGSMYPRFLMPEKMQKFGLLTINAWALDGFQKVFWREEPLSAIAPQVAVLVGVAAVFFLGARRIARRWEAA